MKNIKIVSASAIALGLAFAGSASAQSAGTISFIGSVADATCTVSGGAGANPGVGSFSVDLVQADPADLDTAGDTINAKTFNVVIGGPGQASCVNGTIATMSFLANSPQIDAATGNLNNALPANQNGAENVQIQLLNGGQGGAAINLATGSYSAVSPAVANNTAIIPFGVQYFATGAATPGVINTSVGYQVVYN